MLTINVQYKLLGDSNFSDFMIEPRNYFWRDMDNPAEPWEFDSEPIHNHVADLLNLDDQQILEYASIHVRNTKTGDYQECAYHFWHSRDDYACLVTHSSAGRICRELIISGNVPFKDNGNQVLRIQLDGAFPLLTMNYFMWGKNGDEYSQNMLRDSAA